MPVSWWLLALVPGWVAGGRVYTQDTGPLDVATRAFANPSPWPHAVLQITRETRVANKTCHRDDVVLRMLQDLVNKTASVSWQRNHMNVTVTTPTTEDLYVHMDV